MLLLPNEEQILTSNDNKIILTTKSIQQNDSYWCNSFQTTIFLEDISSIEKGFISYVLFLALGCISSIAGALFYFDESLNEKEKSSILLVVGIVLIAFWFLSRKHVIRIKPNGGKSIHFIISRMADSAVEDFIYKISKAKDERVASLSKNK